MSSALPTTLSPTSNSHRVRAIRDRLTLRLLSAARSNRQTALVPRRVRRVRTLVVLHVAAALEGVL